MATGRNKLKIVKFRRFSSAIYWVGDIESALSGITLYGVYLVQPFLVFNIKFTKNLIGPFVFIDMINVLLSGALTNWEKYHGVFFFRRTYFQVFQMNFYCESVGVKIQKKKMEFT